MNVKVRLLSIIGAIIILGVGGAVGYALMHKDTTDDMSAMDMEGSHSHMDMADDSSTSSNVTIRNYAFSSSKITVKVGTKVTWTNEDQVGHTVTTDDGTPEKIASGLIDHDKTFSYTFTKTGTYTYFCEPHPYMKGTVIVTN